MELKDFNQNEIWSIYNIITNNTKLTPNQILNIYMIGSQIYETNNHNSDYDFIIVNTIYDNQEIRDSGYNITLYKEDTFQKNLEKNKMIFIEAHFSPCIFQYKKDFNFIINKELLIKETLKNSLETFNKAKMFLEKDKINKCINKLFHSIRVLGFLEQLLHFNNIYNFKAMNYFYNEIKTKLYQNKNNFELFENLRFNYAKIIEDFTNTDSLYIAIKRNDEYINAYSIKEFKEFKKDKIICLDKIGKKELIFDYYQHIYGNNQPFLNLWKDSKSNVIDYKVIESNNCFKSND